MRAGIFGALALSLLIACRVAPEDEEGEGEAAVQSAGDETHFVVASSLSGAERAAQRATASLQVPWRDGAGQQLAASDGTPIRATCGVTFIDRTHAITAAHCVPKSDVPDPPSAELPVDFIDVTVAADWRRASRLDVASGFPSWSHAPITTGYDVTTITCSVAVRCGSEFGPYRCPDAATADDVDIAMLECPEGMPADRGPVAVAESDPERGPVSMFWFHEIYDVPSKPSFRASADDFAVEDPLFEHYSAYAASPTENFHYFGGGRNQLLPLASVAWSDGSPRVRVGRTGYTVFTDMFGCHGTSGSGVLQRNDATGRYELLGPVTLGGPQWGNAYLCTDPDALRHGSANIGYAILRATRAVAALGADASSVAAP